MDKQAALTSADLPCLRRSTKCLRGGLWMPGTSSRLGAREPWSHVPLGVEPPEVRLLRLPSSKWRCPAPGEWKKRQPIAADLRGQAITRVFNAVGDHAKMMEVRRQQPTIGRTVSYDLQRFHVAPVLCTTFIQFEILSRSCKATATFAWPSCGKGATTRQCGQLN